MRGKREKERQEREQQKKRAAADARQRERAVRAAIADIAQALGETDMKAKVQIERIVTILGIEQANAFLQQTQEIETQGGMLLPDNSRRRSPGGVFFYLVRQSLKEAERQEEIKAIFNKPIDTPALKQHSVGAVA